MAITRVRAVGRMAGGAGSGATGFAQPPKVFSARAKPCSAVISPVRTRTALSGRYQAWWIAARSAGLSRVIAAGVPDGTWPNGVPPNTSGAAAKPATWPGS